jgi:hypothetical protein
MRWAKIAGWAAPHWVKVKNPKAPAVKREAEEDWGNRRSPLPPPWSVEVSCSKILDWKSSKFFYSGRYRSSCVTARQIMLYQKAPLVPFFTGIM